MSPLFWKFCAFCRKSALLNELYHIILYSVKPYSLGNLPQMHKKYVYIEIILYLKRKVNRKSQKKRRGFPSPQNCFYLFFVATSTNASARKASTDLETVSPARLRTDTVPSSISLAPMMSIYGTFWSWVLRIL